ncbi:MAG: AAA+ family ATPase [Proteobacteria bacterium]|nr:AAA+ family ATPase [Pseudomonadota bacterium]MBS0573203.1 AAA+ family ATPase [Pseudomonadota bacterium]
MGLMRSIALCLVLAAGPVAAEEGRAASGDGLFDLGARMVIGALIDRAGPQLQELRDTLEVAAGFVPALRALAGAIDDPRNYAPPVMLPNGDIILRRRAPLPLPGPEAPSHALSGAIDL